MKAWMFIGPLILFFGIMELLAFVCWLSLKEWGLEEFDTGYTAHFLPVIIVIVLLPFPNVIQEIMELRDKLYAFPVLYCVSVCIFVMTYTLPLWPMAKIVAMNKSERKITNEK